MSSTLSMNALTGMVIYSKTTKELEEEKFLCPTKCLFIQQNNIGETGLEYNEEYSRYIVENEDRNKKIVEIANKYSKDNKILILTRRVRHAEILGRMISNSIVITGQTGGESRKQMFEEFKNESGLVLVGSVKIFSAGINLPDLSIVLNASGHRSSIDSIQIIGRVKRLSLGKTYGYFIDFIDSTKYLQRASKERAKILKRFGNEIIQIYDIKDIDILPKTG